MIAQVTGHQYDLSHSLLPSFGRWEARSARSGLSGVYVTTRADLIT